MLCPSLSLTLWWSCTIYFSQKTLHGSSADKISLKHVIYFHFWKLRGGRGGPGDLIKIKQPRVQGFFFAYPLPCTADKTITRKYWEGNLSARYYSEVFCLQRPKNGGTRPFSDALSYSRLKKKGSISTSMRWHTSDKVGMYFQAMTSSPMP